MSPEEIAGQNRRKSLRSPLMVARIKGDMDGKAFFGYAKNISRGGLFISTINPRPVGEAFTIEFEINEIQLHVRCKAEVIWARPYQAITSLDPGMGIKFIELPESVQKRIDEWICSSSQEKKFPHK